MWPHVGRITVDIVFTPSGPPSGYYELKRHDEFLLIMTRPPVNQYGFVDPNPRARSASGFGYTNTLLSSVFSDLTHLKQIVILYD